MASLGEHARDLVGIGLRFEQKRAELFAANRTVAIGVDQVEEAFGGITHTGYRVSQRRKLFLLSIPAD